MKTIAAMITLYVILLAGIFIPSIYGIILAFKASVILGVLVFLIEPTPFILGWCAIFGYADVAQKIAHWLGM